MHPKVDHSPPRPFILICLIASTFSSHKLYLIWCWQVLFLKATLSGVFYLTVGKWGYSSHGLVPDLTEVVFLCHPNWAFVNGCSFSGHLDVRNLKNYSDQGLEGIKNDMWKIKLGQKSSLPWTLSKVAVNSEEHLITCFVIFCDFLRCKAMKGCAQHLWLLYFHVVVKTCCSLCKTVHIAVSETNGFRAAVLSA